MAYNQTKKQAESEAKICKQKMNVPSKWKMRLWENMGWHWSLSHGHLKVTGGLDSGKYSADVTSESEGSSMGSWCKFNDDEYATHNSDPVVAVTEAIRQYSDWYAEEGKAMHDMFYSITQSSTNFIAKKA